MLIQEKGADFIERVARSSIILFFMYDLLLYMSVLGVYLGRKIERFWLSKTCSLLLPQAECKRAVFEGNGQYSQSFIATLCLFQVNSTLFAILTLLTFRFLNSPAPFLPYYFSNYNYFILLSKEEEFMQFKNSAILTKYFLQLHGYGTFFTSSHNSNQIGTESAGEFGHELGSIYNTICFFSTNTAEYKCQEQCSEENK